MQQIKNEIVHVALVLDASGSMARLESKVVRVADEQIKAMKTRSEELDLETRISVYRFSYRTDIECLVFDKDVFRLPSIDGLYHASGQTALVDATVRSQNDLAQTAQMYGKHHFLTFVLTDGMENDSLISGHQLASQLAKQGDNWSVAALVPDKTAASYAVHAGFPADNVLVWDVSVAGLEAVGKKVAQATSNYMTSISRGTGYDKTNVFGTGADKVNAATIASAGLQPEPIANYLLMQVTKDQDIASFVKENNGGVFRLGRGYYPFTKMETIQGNKDIAIVSKNGAVYRGSAARDVLGLTSSTQRVRPDMNPDYTIYVQSTAPNRKLIAGTKLLYFV